ncbi:MFS transporter [Haloferacaceae archaeon DSL9]
MSRARLFGSLCGLVFLVNLARIVFAPLLNVFIAEFSITEGTAGLIATLAWIGSAAPRLPTGWVLTKVQRHRVILVSGTILALASAFAATAQTITQLMAGAFLMGIASGVYFVSANPFLSELYPQRVGRVMGIHGTASQVAAVIAAPFVAIALLFDWRLSFLAIAVAAAINTAVTWWIARKTSLPDAGKKDRALLGAAITEWRVILTGLAVMGVAAFVWQGVFNFYELYMINAKGLSSGSAQLLLTLVFAAGVPAFFIGGDIADRLPHVPYLLGILAAFVAGIALLVTVSGFVSIVLVTAYVGFVIHALFPAVDTYLLDTLPDATRGSAYAVYSSAAMLAQATGSWVVGLFVDFGFTYDAVFGGFAGVLFVAVLVLFGCAQAGYLPRTAAQPDERAAAND